MSATVIRDAQFQGFLEAERSRPVQRNLFTGEFESLKVDVQFPLPEDETFFDEGISVVYGLFLGKKSERLIVRKDKNVVYQFPFFRIQEVVIASKGFPLIFLRSFALGDRETMASSAGLFLAETWRLAPAICDFTSELFYENRLEPRIGLERQRINGSTKFAGAGLWFVPVEHDGNQNSCAEEVERIVEVVEDLLQDGVTWTDMYGTDHPLQIQDILIVAPYNAQVFAIAEQLPKSRVGTVDKFQGQEAPVVIYSMATSSREDAPRGMEFLYNVHRLNVATSRARCACILVANPQLFEPECQTPRQMKLANALCRYAELAKTVG